MKNTRKNLIKLLKTMARVEERAQHQAGEANDTIEFKKREYSALLCSVIANMMENEATFNLFKECFESADKKGENK